MARSTIFDNIVANISRINPFDDDERRRRTEQIIRNSPRVYSSNSFSNENKRVQTEEDKQRDGIDYGEYQRRNDQERSLQDGFDYGEYQRRVDEERTRERRIAEKKALLARGIELGDVTEVGSRNLSPTRRVLREVATKTTPIGIGADAIIDLIQKHDKQKAADIAMKAGHFAAGYGGVVPVEQIALGKPLDDPDRYRGYRAAGGIAHLATTLAAGGGGAGWAKMGTMQKLGTIGQRGLKTMKLGGVLGGAMTTGEKLLTKGRLPTIEEGLLGVGQGGLRGLEQAPTHFLTNAVVNDLSSKVAFLKPLSESGIAKELPVAGQSFGEAVKSLGRDGLKRIAKATLIESPYEAVFYGVRDKEEGEKLIDSITDEWWSNLVWNVGYAGLNTATDAISARDILGQALNDSPTYQNMVKNAQGGFAKLPGDSSTGIDPKILTKYGEGALTKEDAKTLFDSPVVQKAVQDSFASTPKLKGFYDKAVAAGDYRGALAMISSKLPEDVRAQVVAQTTSADYMDAAKQGTTPPLPGEVSESAKHKMMASGVNSVGEAERVVSGKDVRANTEDFLRTHGYDVNGKMGQNVTAGDMQKVGKQSGELPVILRDTPRKPFSLRYTHAADLERLRDFEDKKLVLPSVAVTRSGQDIPFGDRDAVFLFGEDQVRPEAGVFKTYSNDIWSPVTPAPEYKTPVIPRSVVDDLSKRNIYVSDLSHISKDDFIERLTDDIRGKADSTRDKQVFDVDSAKKLADSVFGEPHLTFKRTSPTGNIKEFIDSSPAARKMYKESKNFEEFMLLVENDQKLSEKLYKKYGEDYYDVFKEDEYYEFAPYNADNMAKKMMAEGALEDPRAAQKHPLSGGGRVPDAVAAREYKSMDDLYANMQRLRAGDVDKINEKVRGRVDNYLYDVFSKLHPDAKPFDDRFFGHPLGDIFRRKDLLADVVEVIRDKGTLTDTDLKSILGVDEGYLGAKETYENIDVKKLEKLVKDAYLDTPVKYFESKATRNVDVGEAKAVLVPKDKAEVAREILGSNMNVLTYDPDIKGDASRVIDQYYTKTGEELPVYSQKSDASLVKQLLKDQRGFIDPNAKIGGSNDPIDDFVRTWKGYKNDTQKFYDEYVVPKAESKGRIGDFAMDIMEKVEVEGLPVDKAVNGFFDEVAAEGKLLKHVDDLEKGKFNADEYQFWRSELRKLTKEKNRPDIWEKYLNSIIDMPPKQQLEKTRDFLIEFRDRGGYLLPTNNTSANTSLEALRKEAAKYDSAGEFVAAQSLIQAARETGAGEVIPNDKQLSRYAQRQILSGNDLFKLRVEEIMVERNTELTDLYNQVKGGDVSIKGILEDERGAINPNAKVELPVTTKRPTYAQSQKLIEKEGGFANMESLAAKNRYAADELAGSLGLNAKYLYDTATQKGIDLGEYLSKVDAQPENRAEMGANLVALLNGDTQTKGEPPVVLGPGKDKQAAMDVTNEAINALRAGDIEAAKALLNEMPLASGTPKDVTELEKLQEYTEKYPQAQMEAQQIEAVRGMFSDDEIKTFNRIKNVVGKTKLLQAGDIETARQNKTLSKILPQALELVQEKNKQITSDDEAYEFIKSFPTKAAPPQMKPPFADDRAPEGAKERKFITQVKEAERTPDPVRDAIEGFYKQLSNKETYAAAQQKVSSNYDDALRFARTQDVPKGEEAVHTATQIALIDKAQEDGNYELMRDYVEEFAKSATAKGQAVQAYALYSRLTPTGAVRYAQSVVDEANKKLPKNKKIQLTTEETETVSKMAEEIQEMPDGREKTIKAAQMMAFIGDKVPSSFWEKVSMTQTFAQLLNIKTALRNLIGNTGFSGLENAKDVFATPLDTLVGHFTGIRTKALPSVRTQLSGAVEGAKQGIEEVRAGVDLKQQGNKWDIPQGKVFKSKLGRALHTALDIELKVPDRAFYQAAYNESLRQQMKAAKVDTPTDEMKVIAHEDGLYRTFQDDSTAAQALQSIKKTLNKITPGTNGEWGLGDAILKYPKTPGNLLARGIEYTPAGLIKSMAALNKARGEGGFTAKTQKEFVEYIGRAATGTTLIAAGMLLHRLGVLTGAQADRDRDVQQLDREMGLGKYKLNVDALSRFVSSVFNPAMAEPQEGDTIISFDWLQPQAVNFAIGADIDEHKGKDEGVAAGLSRLALGLGESIASASDTLLEQPLLQGLQTLFGYRDLPQGVMNTLKAIPASFVPTFLNQIRQWTDKTARNTSDPDFATEALNRVQYRLPVFSKNLPPQVGVFGEDLPVFQKNNDFTSVFLNPAFVSEYKTTPEGREVLRMYEDTGVSEQAPRKIGRTVDVNGSTYKMTGEEQAAMQRYTGRLTQKAYAALVADPEFMQAPDTEKAKVMANLMTDIHTAARIQLLGHRPKQKPSKRVLSILKAQDFDPNTKELPVIAR